MSQVIVTKDKWKNRRTVTREQEKKINTEGQFKRWHMNDISKGYGPITKALFLAVSPIAVIWSFLTALMTFTVGIAIAICRGLAYVVQPLIPKSNK